MTEINPHISSEISKLSAEKTLFTILCVDDEISVLKSLKRLLRSPNYRILTANNGQEGLNIMNRETIDIVISDMRMPKMDGAELLSQIANTYPQTVRLLLTGYSDINSTIEAVNKGKITQYIQKPWNNDELLITLRQCAEKLILEKENHRLLIEIENTNQSLASLNISLEEKVKKRTQQINAALCKLKSANSLVKNNLNSTIRSFYNLISLHPKLGGESSLKISELCSLLAHKTMNSPKEIKDVQLAGLLSELGMIGMTGDIWKTPIEELPSELKQKYIASPKHAYIALSPATPLKNVADIIFHQHEIYSGRGFPEKLVADQIPLGSRILSVARDYIYATSGRLFSTRLSSQGAIQFLTQHAGFRYDPAIVSLLPTVIDLINHNTLAKNEQIIAFSDLKPGMCLSRDVLNSHKILLLPEGHIFNKESLTRLQKFISAENTPLEIFVLT